jgi:hypothetical protein
LDEIRLVVANLRRARPQDARQAQSTS